MEVSAETAPISSRKVHLSYRLEYRRAPSSWEGDPAPSLAPPIDPAELFNPDEVPKADLVEADVDDSLGELRPVEVVDID